MAKGPFSASQFIATQFDSSEEKAAFGNVFLHFIESEWKRTFFTKRFYIQLSNCYGHIAHFDVHGFYATWFTTEKDRLEFLKNALAWPCYGSPEHTFCDVERAIQQEIRKRKYVESYQLRAAEELRSAEMAVLERLEKKYRAPTVQAMQESEPVDVVLRQEPRRDALTLPVQQSLF
jgi:hypothetical protein